MLEAYAAKKFLPALAKMLLNIKTKRQAELSEIYDTFGDARELSLEYIEPDCQQGNPADDDDLPFTIKRPAFELIDTYIKSTDHRRDGRNQVFILADAGMGKTSLLMMTKLFHLFSFWPKGYNCRIFKLGHSTLDYIERIENKSNTVLLLDALDEDPLAWVDYKGRIALLLRATSKFKNTFITCRTQFFPLTDTDPFNRSGMISINGFQCPVYYLSLFSDEQVREYLLKKFDNSIEKAKECESIISLMHSLKSRPLLLSHIDDLLASQSRIETTYEVYSALINAWLYREVRKHNLLNYDALKAASIITAIYMTNRGKRSIEKRDLDTLRSTNKEISMLDHLDVGGRSLMNKNSEGDYRFSHYSIQEYLIAESIIRQKISTQDIERAHISALTLEFLSAYQESKAETELSKDSNEPGLVLKNSSVKNTDLSNSCFFGLTLENSSLLSVSLKNSQMRLSNFERASIQDCAFHFSRFGETSFRHCRIEDSIFKNSFMATSIFYETSLLGVSFDGSDLLKADFQSSTLLNCKFKNADLTHARFVDSKIVNCDFRNCKNLTATQILSAKEYTNCLFDDNLQALVYGPSLEKNI